MPDLRPPGPDDWTFTFRVHPDPDNVPEGIRFRRLLKFAKKTLHLECISYGIPEPDLCEHGVPDGDWCPDCNREYKRTAQACE